MMSALPLEADVLEGGSRSTALATLQALAVELPAALPPKPRDLSLRHTSEYIWSLASAALFFAYLARVELVSGDHEETAEGFLEAAISLTEEVPDVRPSLYGGVAGLGWTIHHVGRLSGDRDPVATDALDRELFGYLEDLDPTPSAFDLMGGLVGLGVYGAEAENRQLVELVVDRLAAAGVRDRPDGLSWWTPSEIGGRAFYSSGHFNLGLAHGVAGVLAFLAEEVRGNPRIFISHGTDDGVLRITLDGPGLNAVGHEAHRELADVWLAVDRDPLTCEVARANRPDGSRPAGSNTAGNPSASVNASCIGMPISCFSVSMAFSASPRACRTASSACATSSSRCPSPSR